MPGGAAHPIFVEQVQTMMKRTVLSLLAVSALAVTAFAANVKSGLKPGESVGAFQVVDVTGPSKGKQLCYRCQYGGAPVVAAFIKADAPEAGALAAGIQKLVQENNGLRTFVVFMGGPEVKPMIEKIAAEKKITIPLTFLPEGAKADDIASYHINPEATNTVLLWNKGAVRANFANVTKESWSNVSKAAQDLTK
jgi:hypothetical protein